MRAQRACCALNEPAARSTSRLRDRPAWPAATMLCPRKKKTLRSRRACGGCEQCDLVDLVPQRALFKQRWATTITPHAHVVASPRLSTAAANPQASASEPAHACHRPPIAGIASPAARTRAHVGTNGRALTTPSPRHRARPARAPGPRADAPTAAVRTSHTGARVAGSMPEVLTVRLLRGLAGAAFARGAGSLARGAGRIVGGEPGCAGRRRGRDRSVPGAVSDGQRWGIARCTGVVNISMSKARGGAGAGVSRSAGGGRGDGSVATIDAGRSRAARREVGGAR